MSLSFARRAKMRTMLGALLALTSVAVVQVSAALNVSPVKPNIDGVYALAKRQIPKHANAFTFKLVEGEDDTFTISDAEHKGGIVVECTSVSACSRGLYTYVAHFFRTERWLAEPYSASVIAISQTSRT